MEARDFSAARLEVLRPWVARQVRRLRVERDRLLASAEDAPGPAVTLATGGAYAGAERARATVRLVLTLEALEERGFVVRDLDRGLVEAPVRADGRLICWLVDESEIRRWHRAATRREPPPA